VSLRARILALAVGATATVLVLFAIPLVLLLQRSAAEEGREGAADVARSVADYVSTGSAGETLLAAYVDRLNARDDSPPVTVRMPDGTLLGAALPEGASEYADHDAAEGGGLPGEDGDRDDDQLMPVSDAEAHEVDGGELVSVHAGTADGQVLVVAFAAGSDVREKLIDRLLLLGAAAAGLLVLAAAAAEIVSRRLVRQLASSAAAADRLARGRPDRARTRSTGPRRYAASRTPSTGSRTASTTCSPPSARRSRTSPTGCGPRSPPYASTWRRCPPPTAARSSRPTSTSWSGP